MWKAFVIPARCCRIPTAARTSSSRISGPSRCRPGLLRIRTGVDRRGNEVYDDFARRLLEEVFGQFAGQSAHAVVSASEDEQIYPVLSDHFADAVADVAR